MAKNKIKMAVEGKATNAPERTIAHEDAERRKWHVESALRTIEEAEMHKRDKALMKEVKAHAKERMKSMSKVVSGK